MGFWWDFSNVCLGMIVVWITLGVMAAIKEKKNGPLIVAMVLSTPGFLIYMWVHLLQ